MLVHINIESDDYAMIAGVNLTRNLIAGMACLDSHEANLCESIWT